jgi:hypothetical protein
MHQPRDFWRETPADAHAEMPRALIGDEALVSMANAARRAITATVEACRRAQ